MILYLPLDSNDSKSGRHANNSLYRRQPSVNATGSSPLLHSTNANVSSAASGNANVARFHAGLSRDTMGGIGGRGMTSMHPGSSRAPTDLLHDAAMTQPVPDLSGRRPQQQQHQQVNCSAVSNLTGAYRTTPDLDDSANDSLISQLFGTSSGQSDICSSTLVSRPLQPSESNPMDADAASSAMVGAPSGVEALDTNVNRVMGSRHALLALQ